MTRASRSSDDVANARRDRTFVLIKPVTTSTDGRWVAVDQVDARRTRLLRYPHDRVPDVAGSGHHQVGELVDDREDVRIRLVVAFGPPVAR